MSGVQGNMHTLLLLHVGIYTYRCNINSQCVYLYKYKCIGTRICVCVYIHVFNINNFATDCP